MKVWIYSSNSFNCVQQTKIMELQHPYCKAVQSMDRTDPNVEYHDNEYGFPIDNDNELFGRLILEINQAGLSWSMILKRKEGFYQGYAEFDISKVAAFDDGDIKRLKADKQVIRNELKIKAAIHNANQIRLLQDEYGSFKSWLDSNHPKLKEDWVKLFKKTFKFTGNEITGEFLLSTGYLEGAHDRNCPIYSKILKEKPKWLDM